MKWNEWNHLTSSNNSRVVTEWATYHATRDRERQAVTGSWSLVWRTTTNTDHGHWPGQHTPGLLKVLEACSLQAAVLLQCLMWLWSAASLQRVCSPCNSPVDTEWAQGSELARGYRRPRPGTGSWQASHRTTGERVRTQETCRVWGVRQSLEHPTGWYLSQQTNYILIIICH